MTTIQTCKNVIAFMNAVQRINTFFFFDSELFDYCDRALSILKASPSGNETHKANILRCLTHVQSKFRKLDYPVELIELPPPQSLTEEDTLDFYQKACLYICRLCFKDDDDFEDHRFNYPRVLNHIKALIREETEENKLDMFLQHVETFSYRDGSGANTSHFWEHIASYS